MKLVLIFLLTLSVLSEDKNLPLTNDFVNFDNIKNVLKKDGLETVLEKKQVVEKNKTKVDTDKIKKMYNTPSRQDFWPVMLQYWLVKNAAILKWDFDRPDYGMMESFQSFLKDVGEIGVNFKILFLNSSNITHFAFPYGKDSYLFIVSVPFIKTMDLSKLEISIMLYEDLIRVKQGHFESTIKESTLKPLIDANFYQLVAPTKQIKDLLLEIDNTIYVKGFSFQQQYQVTKYVNSVLLNNKKYWQGYYSLITKIDDTVKTNLMYQSYVKIYPSPELQKNWIDPTKKK